MLAAFARLNATLGRTVETGLAVLGLTMAAVVTLEVFFRYYLNDSLFWAEELARYILVWLTFLGATSAYRRGAHPGLDLLTAKMGSRLHRANRILVHILCLGFFLVMIIFGVKFSYFVRLQITPALGLPKWIVFAVIPLSGLLFACHCLYFLAVELWGNGHDH